MNNKTILTFRWLMTILLLFSYSYGWAGIGGASGGGVNQKLQETQVLYTTIDKCYVTEMGQHCEQIRVKIKPSKLKNSSPVCMVLKGEQEDSPCPKSYGIPKWLQNLNEYFIDDLGTTAPENDLGHLGGP